MPPLLTQDGLAGFLGGGNAVLATFVIDLYQKVSLLEIPFLVHPKFTLNTGGVAGFFGGEEAISAMATVHLYEGRRWLGWFNSPGSYIVAKRFGRMANSRFWHGLFPGPNDSPAVSFGLDSDKGPQYIAPLSGTKMRARHLARLVMERSKETRIEKLKGRVSAPSDVAYLAMHHVDYDRPVQRLSYKRALYGFIPIVTSVVTCAMCALVNDWFCFSLILIGIISSGLASFYIGKGELAIVTVREPATGSPPGHGILMGRDGVMVIRGEERDVNAITKGRFTLDLERHSGSGDGRNSQRGVGGEMQGGEEGQEGGRRHNAIGICSLGLLIQFLLQLLLIPQATLFGQIMFLISLGVSWGYNSYLSSLEKEKIQAEILFQKLGYPEMRRFRAGTQTTMAVFACLLLFHGVEHSSEEEDISCRIWILEELLPNKTGVWRLWRERVARQLLNINDHLLSHLADDKQEPQLLRTLLGDARTAFEEFLRVRDDLPPGYSQPHVVR